MTVCLVDVFTGATDDGVAFRRGGNAGLVGEVWR